ncbi:MAG: sigma-70 RNA polymerase sigma factor region 4 domain-containing protein [Phycisphaerales bacterium]
MGIPRHFIVYPSVNHIIICRASRLSRRWPFLPSDRPDIEQSMRQHLIERLERFDPDRGTLQMFAEAVLSTWELQQFRDSSRLKRRGQRSTRPLASVPEHELGSRAWREIEGDIEARDLLRRCFERLDAEEQAMLRLVAAHGERRTAELLGITRHRTRQLMSLIREKCADLDKNDENPDRS